MDTLLRRPSISADEAREKYFINSDGARLTISLYDVPEGISTSFDPKSNQFTVRFAYVTPGEATKSVDVGPNITVYVGKHSNRLYRLIVSGVKKVKLFNIQSAVMSAVDELKRNAEERPDRDSEKLHYRYMDDLLRQQASYAV
jgi:hypothetical protein